MRRFRPSRSARLRPHRAAHRATKPVDPAGADDECCCVCLERLLAAAQAHQLPVPFLSCRRHRMHLGCLAQYRAQAASPADLLCPLCRHGRCPDCAPMGWSGAADEELRLLCQRHGVSMPDRIAGESTVREAVRDYALRTFTSNDAPEPRPPPGVTLLCCNRLAAVSRPGGVDFLQLPHRDMQWAPAPIRHDAGIASWRPGWVCPGCAQEVRLDSIQIPVEGGGPCQRCGAQLQWALDHVVGRATWSCTPGCPGPQEPSDAPTGVGSALQAGRPADGPPSTTAPVRPPGRDVSAPASGNAAPFWLSRGTSQEPIPGCTSHCCMPRRPTSHLPPWRVGRPILVPPTGGSMRAGR